jgi:CYTH domain-containing protein
MKAFREIEKKFTVADEAMCQQQVDAVLRSLLQGQTDKEIAGNSADHYYLPRTPETADFVRLRTFNDEQIELTVKKKDKASNLNRLEINLSGGPASEATALCDAAFGPSITKIQKQYTVFFTKDAVVSTYVIEGVNKVYVEVEASSTALVHRVSKDIKKVLDLVDEKRSLFEIYVEPKIAPSFLRAVMGVS